MFIASLLSKWPVDALATVLNAKIVPAQEYDVFI